MKVIALQPDELPFFEPDGVGYRATARAVGPWDSDTIGGGPLAALVLHELERQGREEDFALLRLTMDLLRPAPAKRLDPRTRVHREGRRLRVVESAMEVDGVAVCRASAVFARISPSIPNHLPPVALAPHPPPENVPALPRIGSPSYVTSMQVRPVTYPSTDARAVVWVSFPHRLLPGVDLSPNERAALAADAVSGFAFMTDEGVTAINCDLTLNVIRQPIGEWICIEVERRAMQQGIAVATAALRDPDGFFGQCVVGALAVLSPLRVARARS